MFDYDCVVEIMCLCVLFDFGEINLVMCVVFLIKWLFLDCGGVIWCEIEILFVNGIGFVKVVVELYGIYVYGG